MDMCRTGGQRRQQQRLARIVAAPDIWAIFVVVAVVFVNAQTITAIAWSPFAYDDSHITQHLEDRFPYLKLKNGSYLGPRDYFNFSHLHEPSREYLERVNLEQHLYEEIKSMEITSSIATMDQWHYTNKQLEQELDGEANEKLCYEELDYLANQVQRANLNSSHLFEKGYENHQLLRLLDSWGRPPSETYFGNSYWVGSYRGCKVLRKRTNSSLDSGYRYCWAKIRAKDWPQKEEIVPPTSIRVGVCLPDSCNTRLANKKRELILDIMKFNFSPMHRQRFNKIIHVYCLPLKTTRSMARDGRAFSIAICNWLFLLTCLSAISAYLGGESLPSILRNLTIQENYRKFRADDEPPAVAAGQNGPNVVVDLRAIGVVRFVTTVAVCLGHCGCSFGWIFLASSFNIVEVRKPIHNLTISLLKSGDVFWILSGLLTSYTILGQFSRQNILKPPIYLATIVARYLRSAAMQALVLSFMKAIYITLGEGPWWDYGTYKYSLQGQCQRSSWWRVLLWPIVFSAPGSGNNYRHECLPVSWHIVADMKLSLVVPLLVYLLSSPPRTRDGGLSSRTRWFTIIGISTVSLLAQYNDLTKQQIIYYQQFFKYSHYVAINMLAMAFGETGYFNVLTRLFPLSVGLLGGIYLRERQQQQQLDQSWPRWMCGWSLIAMIVYQIYDFVSPMLAQHLYLEHGQMPSEQAIKLALLLKPRIDSIMFGVLIVRATSDLAPAIMVHAKSFYKLGKLSYCVLLVHPIVISLLVNIDESSRMNMFGSELIRLMVCCVTLSYLISFPLYILFESPLASLSTVLFKRRPRRRLNSESVPVGIADKKRD